MGNRPARGKNGSINFMTCPRDVANLEVDVFHSMICYFITQGGVQKGFDEQKLLLLCFENLHMGEDVQVIS